MTHPSFVSTDTDFDKVRDLNSKGSVSFVVRNMNGINLECEAITKL